MLVRRKPEHGSTVWVTHGLIAAGLLGIFALAWVLPYDREMIPFCTAKRWFNLPCPFCGSTRTFAAAVKGHWGWALQNNPLAFGLFLLTVMGLVWNGLALVFREVWLPTGILNPSRLSGRMVFWILFIGVAANYAYRLLQGLS